MRDVHVGRWSGDSFLAKGSNPTPRDDEPRKCNPLLKEKARHEIDCPAERLRWYGLEPVAPTLERDRHDNAPQGNKKQNERTLDDCCDKNNVTNQKQRNGDDVDQQIGARLVILWIPISLPPEKLNDAHGLPMKRPSKKWET